MEGPHNNNPVHRYRGDIENKKIQVFHNYLKMITLGTFISTIAIPQQNKINYNEESIDIN